MGRLRSLEKMTPKKAIFSTVLSKIVASLRDPRVFLSCTVGDRILLKQTESRQIVWLEISVNT